MVRDQGNNWENHGKRMRQKTEHVGIDAEGLDFKQGNTQRNVNSKSLDFYLLFLYLYFIFILVYFIY